MIIVKLNTSMYCQKRDNRFIVITDFKNFIHGIEHIDNGNQEIIVGFWQDKSSYKFVNHRGFTHNPHGPAKINFYDDFSTKQELYFESGVVKTKKQKNYEKGEKYNIRLYPRVQCLIDNKQT